MKITKSINALVERAVQSNANKFRYCTLCGRPACAIGAYVPADGRYEEKLRLASGTDIQKPVLLYAICCNCSPDPISKPIEIDRLFKLPNRLMVIEAVEAALIDENTDEL
jgi:hypothetical protein